MDRQEQKQTKLLAAMAIASITPDTDVYLEGYEGKDAFSLCHCPEDFTSDLCARILLLDNGAERLVFLNLELVFSDSTEQYACVSRDLLEKIAQVCHTGTDHILLSNTHTHHAPMQLGRVQEEHVLKAVERAWAKRVPAVICMKTGHTRFGVSRSYDYTIDKSRPYDDVVTLLNICEADTNKPIGMVFTVPIHNTLYGHGPDLRKNRHLLNCEFTGYACRAIEKQFAEQNPGFVVMHHNGFTGNAGPLYKERYYAKSLDDLKNAGACLAEEIMGISNLPGTQLSDGAICSLRRLVGLPVKEDDGFKEFFGDFDQVPLRIHTAAWGDVAYLGVNFEPFSVLGAYLRAYAPYRALLLAGTVDGWRGYIPTSQTYIANTVCAEAEVQDWKTPLAHNAADMFVAHSKEALLELAGVQEKAIEADMCEIEKGNYTYVFPETAVFDKLVISFGQELRTDCINDFTICLYDENHMPVTEIAIKDFSSSYLGLWLEHKEIRYVRLSTDLWEAGAMRRIPEITGLQFEKKVQPGM